MSMSLNCCFRKGFLSVLLSVVFVTVSQAQTGPTGGDQLINVIEDQAYSFLLSDFTDLYNDTEGQTLTYLQIASLPTLGSITYSGSPITENTSYPVTELSYITGENGNGIAYETFTFRLVDSNGDISIDAYTATINAAAVNDAPVIADIPNQTIVEGGSFTTISLDGFIDDVETLDANILWSIVETPVNISVVITDRVATITPLDVNWNGNETIIFQAQDEGGLQVTDAVTFTVTADNDLPVISDIPNQTIVEGGSFTTIYLDGFIDDVETLDANIIWSIVETPVNISVVIADRVATITPLDVNWNGNETITFQAQDEGGLQVTDAVTFTVTADNDLPVISDIPNQTIVEGGSFTAISLDGFIDDVETLDANIIWSIVEIPINISVVIADRVATITPLDVNWNGNETITFQAQDEGGLQVTDAVTFTVTADNDLPVISDIPNQTIVEGGSFTAISLDGFIDDVETLDANIIWSIVETPVNISVVIADRVATITPLDVNWNGNETITFQAQDEGGLQVTDAVTFTVTADNDLPVISDIPNQTIVEGGSFTTISLDGFIDDVETLDANIIWSIVETPVNISVVIADRVATITPLDVNWNGNETITFQAQDEGGLQVTDAVTFTVTADNDLPVITDIPNQTIIEGGSFTTISLDGFIDDVETLDANILWSIVETPVNISVVIADRVATITPLDVNWNGNETIIFQAQDEGGLQVTDAVTFTVTADNDLPVITDIPNQTIIEGGSFTTISLDGFIDDVETLDANILWSIVETPVNISVVIADRVATITPLDVNWNGNETIIFQAQDEGGLQVTDAVTFTVTADNDLPVITDIPNQTIIEGGSFTTISLDGFIDDVETLDANILWSIVETPVNISVVITDRVATITPRDVNWNGNETITFQAQDEGGLQVTDAVTFTVTADNDLPVITDIPNQTIIEGGSFTTISLDGFIDDVETLDANILWSIVETPVNISVVITDRVATITPRDVNWNGNETITFQAQDEGGLQVTDAVTFTVTADNDLPVISNIPNQTIVEGSNFTTISLDGFIDDVETLDANIIWSIVETPVNISVVIADRVATITPLDVNWNGNETITFQAQDEGGLQVTDAVTFTVTPINDAPVITGQIAISVAEETLKTISFNDILVSDPDNTYPTGFTMNLQNGVGYIVIGNTITPELNVIGELSVPVYVTDPEGANSNTINLILTVINDNDPPVVTDIPNQTIDEGAQFTDIDLNIYVTDPDHNDNQIIWSALDQTELVVGIDQVTKIAQISTPNADWFGSEIIRFVANDGTLTDEDAVTFVVNPINDAPVVSGQGVIETDEDVPFIIPLTSITASDIDNDYPSEHTLSIQSGDNYTFGGQTITPSQDFNGILTIPVVVNDLGTVNSESNTFNISVAVNAVNDSPVINSLVSALSTNEDVSLPLILADFNVSDVDNSSGDFVLTLHGGDNYSVSGNTILPDENYYGTLSVEVSVSDGETVNAVSSRFAFNVLVTSQNDLPQVDNFSITTAENQQVILDMKAHMDDVDGNLDLSSLKITTDVSNGITNVDKVNGIIMYTPNTSFSGSDSFTYEVCDDVPECSSGIVSITISNEAPTANEDVVALDEDTEFSFNVLANDVDPQGNLDPSTLRIVTQTVNGSSAVLSNGSISYIPNANFNGMDQLVYEVCDQDGYCASAIVYYTINSVNDQPVIDSQQQLSLIEDNSVTLNLNHLNVADVDNAYPNDFILTVQAGDNYTAVGNTVTPNLNFNGDLVVHVIVDDQGTENNLSDVFDFTLQVSPVNDKPVINDQISLTTNEDVSLQINITDLIISDPDNSYPNDFKLVVLPGLNYTSTGTTITPDPNYFGGLNVPVYISDQQSENDRSKIYNLVVQVDALNDAPVTIDVNKSTPEDVAIELSLASMVSDVEGNISLSTFEYISDPEFGQVSAVDMVNYTITYTPQIGFAGEDSFNFRFYDEEGAASNISTITINVTNEAPNAIDEAISLNEDEAAVIDVLANDVDPQDNLDVSTLLIVSNPQNGNATVNNSTGEITYIPLENYNGTDILTYRICDISGYCDEASVQLTINAVNDNPTTAADEIEILEDESGSINVLINDSDIDSDINGFLLTVYTQSQNGTVSIDAANKECIYAPLENFYGTDEFEYQVCDAEGGCSVETVYVTVIPQNDYPEVLDDTGETSQGVSVSIPVILNDSDLDGNLDVTSVTVVNAPLFGEAKVESISGNILYTPFEDFSGEDSFVYRICDTSGACDNATVNVIVTAKNSAPVCTNDTIYLSDGESVSFNVLANDIDVNGDDITVVVDADNQLNGFLTEQANGQFTYVSVFGDFCIQETLNYIGSDQYGNWDSAKVVFVIGVTDTDNDNIANFIEEQHFNTDGDEYPDYDDTDSDNDGIDDVLEGGIDNICLQNVLDSDDDGIPDYRDLDSDNDEVSDFEEGAEDCDMDGIPDFMDDFDDCGERVEAPDTFSPNGDGVNDGFVIQGIKDFENNEIFIYNRWGGEVFRMKNYDNSWDGKSSNSVFGSSELPQGTYFYVVKLGNSNKVIKGTVYIKY